MHGTVGGLPDLGLVCATWVYDGYIASSYFHLTLHLRIRCPLFDFEGNKPAWGRPVCEGETDRDTWRKYRWKKKKKRPHPWDPFLVISWSCLQPALTQMVPKWICPKLCSWFNTLLMDHLPKARSSKSTCRQSWSAKLRLWEAAWCLSPGFWWLLALVGWETHHSSIPVSIYWMLISSTCDTTLFVPYSSNLTLPCPIQAPTSYLLAQLIETGSELSWKKVHFSLWLSSSQGHLSISDFPFLLIWFPQGCRHY